MKRLAPLFSLLVILFAAAPLAAKDSQLQFNTVVVRHFVNANGTSQSQEFINDFAGTLASQLTKLKVAQQVLGEGGTVADAAAANSLSIEGKFTGREKEIYMVKVGKLNVEIDIFRISDHALVKTITAKALIPPSPNKKDQDMAAETASQVANQIPQRLKASTCREFLPRPHRLPVRFLSPPPRRHFQPSAERTRCCGVGSILFRPHRSRDHHRRRLRGKHAQPDQNEARHALHQARQGGFSALGTFDRNCRRRVTQHRGAVGEGGSLVSPRSAVRRYPHSWRLSTAHCGSRVAVRSLSVSRIGQQSPITAPSRLARRCGCEWRRPPG